jgi:hypothetical protein
MAKVRSQGPRQGQYLVVGFALVRYRTLSQARKSLYGGHGEGAAIVRIVENYRKLQGEARPFEETPRTRIQCLVNSKLDPLYASRRAWTTKLRRATTALKRLQRRIAWHERHLPG